MISLSKLSAKLCLEVDLRKIDTRFALMLSMINGIGPAKYQKIIQIFQVYEDILSNSNPELYKDCGLTDKQVSAILKFDRWEKIDQILETADKKEIVIICLGQDGYPEQLTNIYSPPITLYIKGDTQSLSRPSVAIVGSRTPTAYGRSMSRKIASGLASRGLIIVSGLAWGIDSEAHQAAIDAGGATVAVFGSGIDIVYPKEHRKLANDIQNNGCLLSEFPFGTIPERHNFPRRNRLISGLSQAVVVIEAAEKSGALVTANLALEQGRDVFAVPGQADNPKSSGAINLIKQGAAVATSHEDILESLGWSIDKEIKEETQPVNINLEPDEQKVCDLVGKGPAHVDELIRNLGLSTSKISTILLKLELAGIVVRRPGNFVARA